MIAAVTELPTHDYLHDLLVQVGRDTAGSLRRNRYLSLQYHHRPWPKVSPDGCWVLRVKQPGCDLSFFGDQHGWRYIPDVCGRAHWLPLDGRLWPRPAELAGQIELALMGGSPWLPGNNTWRYENPPASQAGGAGSHAGAGCEQLVSAAEVAMA